MKTNVFTTTLFVIATTLTSTMTFANPWEGRGHESDARHGGEMQRHQPMHSDRIERDYDDHRPNFRPATHEKRWQQGDRLPQSYRGNHYRVKNWKEHDLPSPPRGQRWVNVNGDYILVAIATGVITNILMNH